MKRTFIIGLLLMGFSVLTHAQTGTWSGKLEVQGTKLSLVFHLNEENPTMDSPDQGVKGVPIQVERSETGKITVKVPSIGASYEGQWLGKQINGTFKQMGMSFPMTLTPGEEKLNRPQTPQGPFPYAQEEVSFSNGSAVLKGTLVLPEDCTRQTPVLIMVTGSGLQNRDEEIYEHKPFAVIADALARAGIATLRYDDRGFGESTGDIVNCTTEDLKNDALAGIRLLRDRFDKVGVIGHSEGGTIAFMLGAQKKVDFIVSLAGPTVKGDTLLAAQSNRILGLSGQPATMTVEKYRQTVAPMKNHWINWFNDYDPSDNIRKTRCPVFALNGDRDCQVISTLCLPALKQLLPPSKKHLIKEYPSLNHLFQHCTTGLPEEYSQIEETISPEVLQDIVKWINTLK